MTAAVLLVDATLKSALLCLLGMAAQGAMRRRSAALRHLVWLTVLVCCILLPFALIAWRLAAPGLPFAPVHDAVMALTPSLPAAIPPGAIEAVDRIWSGDGGVLRAGMPATAVTLVWLAGFLVAGVRSLIAYRAATAIARRAMPSAIGGAPPGVTVRLSPELSAPALFGIRAPVILLPVEAERWPGDRLEAVLAHEAAHIARRDCAIEALARFACALHWWNPLVWMAARRLREERELACDDRVVGAGLDAGSYAATLVEIARSAGRPRIAALLGMARLSGLERRVVTLLGPRRPAGGGRRSVLLAGLAATAFLTLAALSAPAAGMLGDGSVQLSGGPFAGLDDPMSERVPLPYDRLAATAAAVPARGRDARAIATLKGQLNRRSTGYGDLVRERAIWALVQVRGGQLYEPLVAQTRNPDWRVRAYAAWGLLIAGDRRASPRLALMLDDPVWRVRAMAAGALAGLGDPAPADAVVEALADPAWQVRLAAIDYFDRLGDRRFAEHLRPLLRDPHGATRMRAEEVLARF
ncbi:MAG TPA: M56 family metallopeptidase [Allosphingosinicella sp.]|nr:M56 family metallopeptidase [Allosphingosinicella sp.]